MKQFVWLTLKNENHFDVQLSQTAAQNIHIFDVGISGLI